MGWECDSLETANLSSCGLEAGDKRINTAVNLDMERQCTQTPHQSLSHLPYFPHKTSLLTSLSAKILPDSQHRNWRQEIKDTEAEDEWKGRE